MTRGLIQEVAFGDVTVIEVWEGPVFAVSYGMSAEVVGPYVAKCAAHGVYVNAASREVVLGLPEQCIEWCPDCKQLVEQYRAERQAALLQEHAREQAERQALLEREWAAQERQRLLREQERQVEANRLAFEQAEAEAERARQLYATSPVAATDLVIGTEAVIEIDAEDPPRFAARDGVPTEVNPAPLAPTSAPEEQPSAGNGESHSEALLNAAWALKERIEALEGELKAVKELLARKLGELPESTRAVPFTRGGQLHQIRLRGDKYYVAPLKVPKRKASEGASQ